MNLLILSCNTGEGHNACARAIEEYCCRMGERVVIQDALSFVSEEVSRLIAKSHVLIYRRFSALFGWGYEYARNHRDTFDEDSKIYHFFSRGTESLGEYLAAGGFDRIICTHPFAAMMVTALRKERGTEIPSAFVATDYTCCPGAECSDLDVYFIPHASLLSEFSRCGVPESRLCASGIPVRQAFYSPRARSASKQARGISPQARHIVLACGSMGCGPMEELADRIAPLMDGNTELTIVCGTNSRLQGTMEKMYRENPWVHVCGFVEDMPLLLDSADVYVTKPGGLSVSEARAKGAFMVLVNAVGGCESYNLEHMLREGCAVTGNSAEELTRACLQALEQCKDAPMEPVPNSAQIIYDTMKKRKFPHEEIPMAAATC